MYCKAYRIHTRSGKRIEILHLVFLPLKSNYDKELTFVYTTCPALSSKISESLKLFINLKLMNVNELLLEVS